MICRLISISVLLAGLAWAAPIFAEGQPLTDAMLPVMAAARIFTLENHITLENHVHGDIGVANENEAHIGERFEVNHAVTLDDKLDPCAFTMRKLLEQLLACSFSISQTASLLPGSWTLT
ncbi:hypothetical protein CO683_39235 [Bradyrhizobium ottawaense]|nr:hypothetical protein CO683_39235 [Bradyrhizobium ottawaense]